MARYEIRVTQEVDRYKDKLPKFGWIAYKTIVKGIYSAFFDHLAVNVLSKNYSHESIDLGHKFWIENDDLKVLQKEENQFRSFMFGDVTQLLKKSDKMAKGMQNRWVNKVYTRVKSMATDATTKYNAVTLMAALSINIEWEIINAKEEDKEKKKKAK